MALPITQSLQPASSYLLRAGEGKKLHFKEAEISIIASREQTGGLIEVVEIVAPAGFALPAHLHTHTHKGILVLAGEVQLSFTDRSFHLKEGDYGHVPKGVVHIISFLTPGTRIANLSGPGGVASVFMELAQNQASVQEQALKTFDKADYQLVNDFVAAQPVQEVRNMDRPDGTQAYVISKGGGEHVIVEDQLFSFLARQNNTDGQFLVLMTEGPKGNAIIEHYHRQHAECFYCLEGSMTMWNNGQVIALHPRDFLHVPAGTRHSYRLDSPTRLVGFLAPGLFEPFFDALGTPYSSHSLPDKPGPARFDRVLRNYGKLDLFFVSPPPDGSMQPVQATMVKFSFWLAGKLASKGK